MTLNGIQGNEVVHETQRVTFDCTAGDGRPTPTVRLVSRANGTEVHIELSPLTYSVMARCEDNGVYVCTARNGMGTQEVSVTASLTVQCECAEIVSVWLYLSLVFIPGGGVGVGGGGGGGGYVVCRAHGLMPVPVSIFEVCEGEVGVGTCLQICHNYKGKLSKCATVSSWTLMSL